MSLSLTAQRKAWGGWHGDLVRYRNQVKATRAIQHGMELPEPLCRLEATRCEECGGWHAVNVPMPPEPARPPIDVDKAYGMCTTKKAYLDERTARRVAAQSSEKRGYPVRHYGCPCCGLWHLTKAERQGR